MLPIASGIASSRCSGHQTWIPNWQTAFLATHRNSSVNNMELSILVNRTPLLLLKLSSHRFLRSIFMSKKKDFFCN